MGQNNEVMQAAVSGGSGLLGSIVQGFQSKKNIQRTLKANKELAKYQNAMDIQFWNMQNEYNSPEAQMARYQAAGLNPNLIYGTGSASAGNSNSTVKYPDVRADYTGQLPLVNVPDLISTYQNLELKQAQIDNVKANTQNVEKKSANETIRGILMEAQGRKVDVDINKLKELLPYQRDILSAQQHKIGLENAKLWQENEHNKVLYPLLRAYQKAKNEAVGYDNVMREFRNNLKSMGLGDSDNVALRMLVQWLEKNGYNPLR